MPRGTTDIIKIMVTYLTGVHIRLKGTCMHACFNHHFLWLHVCDLAEHGKSHGDITQLEGRLLQGRSSQT